MAKTIKISSKKAKTAIDLRQKIDFYSWKQLPVPIEFIEEVANDMLQWYKDNPTAIRLDSYYDFKGVEETEIFHWKQRSPLLLRNLNLCKQLLINRREGYAFFKKADTTVFLKSAHNYADDWLKSDEHHAKLSKQSVEGLVDLSSLIPVLKKQDKE